MWTDWTASIEKSHEVLGYDARHVESRLDRIEENYPSIRGQAQISKRYLNAPQFKTFPRSRRHEDKLGGVSLAADTPYCHLDLVFPRGQIRLKPKEWVKQGYWLG